MRLYHGSNCTVSEPRVDFSRERLDFGQGFYLTSHKRQAENWARRKALRTGGVAVLNTYEYDVSESLQTKVFAENDEAWVEFVCACRRGERVYEGYDLVVGGVADDQVFRAVDMYYRGAWDIETTLQALKFYERNDQYCFVLQQAVDRTLRFIESCEVK